MNRISFPFHKIVILIIISATTRESFTLFLAISSICHVIVRENLINEVVGYRPSKQLISTHFIFVLGQFGFIYTLVILETDFRLRGNLIFY